MKGLRKAYVMQGNMACHCRREPLLISKEQVEGNECGSLSTINKNERLYERTGIVLTQKGND